jgi:hypothetical protein
VLSLSDLQHVSFNIINSGKIKAREKADRERATQRKKWRKGIRDKDRPRKRKKVGWYGTVCDSYSTKRKTKVE